jgi:hypothetical protein
MINIGNITTQATLYLYESKIMHSTTVKKISNMETAVIVTIFVTLTVPFVVPSSPAIKPNEMTKTPNVMPPKTHNFTGSLDSLSRPYKAADVGIEPPSIEASKAVYLAACDK